MCEKLLISSHELDLIDILRHPDKEKGFSININFIDLLESDPKLGNNLLNDPENSLKLWNQAVFDLQRKLVKENDKTKFLIKNNVTCRIYSLPPWSHISFTTFPGNAHTEKFIQISGTVTRMSAKKLFEYQRHYLCTKCKYPITVEAKFNKMNIIKAPKRCTNPEGCAGKHIIAFGELDPYNCKDYQEIKIQEDLSKPGIGSTSNHMIVVLEDDLVNTCKPGENVTICGILKRRWSEFSKEEEMKIDMALKANHVQVNNNSGSAVQVSQEIRDYFIEFWKKYRDKPLAGRNVILNSIAPELYGLHLVKLAIAIVLAGGTQNVEESHLYTGTQTRAESHILLVGDPGTGKSELLRFASKTVRRSVLTTGVGSTAAGLTVTSVMDKGQWQLEAGALVMSDGGICCIDEFNSMKEHDRTSIHEAMEQQTISVAKGGIVCKLITRCSILAACNPKGNIDLSKSLCMNVAMSSPLLSRFDLIMLIRDTVNSESDKKLAQNFGTKKDQTSWNLEKLQAYYAVIKEFQPKLTDNAETVISTYYQLQRKLDTRNKSRTTVRLLESLIRLSQGHAKLMFHSEVQIIDTIFAVILVDVSLDYDSSLLSLKVSNNSFCDNPETTYKQLSEVVLRKLNLEYIWQRELERNNVVGDESSGNLFDSLDPNNVEKSIHLNQTTNNSHILTSTQTHENVGSPSTPKQCLQQNIFNKVSKKTHFSSFSQSVPKTKSSFPRFATKFDSLDGDDSDLNKPSNFGIQILARMKSQINIQKVKETSSFRRVTIDSKEDNSEKAKLSQNSESGYSSVNDTTFNKSSFGRHKPNNIILNRSNPKKKINLFARIGSGIQGVDDFDLDFDKPNNYKSKILSQITKRKHLESDRLVKNNETPISGYSSVNNSSEINKSVLNQSTDSTNIHNLNVNEVKNIDNKNFNLNKPSEFKLDVLCEGSQPNDEIANTRACTKLKSFENIDDLEFCKPSKILLKLKRKADLKVKNTPNFENESTKKVSINKSTFEAIDSDKFDKLSDYNSANIISRIKSKTNLESNPTQEDEDLIKKQGEESTKQVSKLLESFKYKPKFQFKSKLSNNNSSNSNQMLVNSLEIKKFVGSDVDIEKCLTNDEINMTKDKGARTTNHNNRFLIHNASETSKSSAQSKTKKNISDVLQAFEFNSSDSKFKKYNTESTSGSKDKNKQRHDEQKISPDKSSKKRKSNTKEVDELAILKNIPSINDDFAKFNLDFDDF